MLIITVLFKKFVLEEFFFKVVFCLVGALPAERRFQPA